MNLVKRLLNFFKKKIYFYTEEKSGSEPPFRYRIEGRIKSLKRCNKQSKKNPKKKILKKIAVGSGGYGGFFFFLIVN